VVLIVIDGMRPDALDSADTPILDELRAKGSYSSSAQTVRASSTLPSIASMLTGTTPDQHGLTLALPYIGWPGLKVPSLFDVARGAGLKTGMVCGKKKLDYLISSDSVDEFICADAHDTQVKERTVEVIQAGMPDILFVHLGDTDRVGHGYGWMSPNQLQSIAFADGLIGEIVAELEAAGYLNNTLMIITADHGGHDFGHGDDSPVDRTIPWLAVGPGVRPGVTLVDIINTYDTAATVLYALRVPVPEWWDGRPVLEAFERWSP
jgi:arylsulfatase A-like enzyme